MSLLTHEEKLEIYDEYLKGETKASLARMYAVSARTIGRAIDTVKKTLETDEGAEETKAVEETKGVESDAPEEGTVNYSFVLTNESLSISHFFNGEMIQHSIDKSHKDFQEIFDEVVEANMLATNKEELNSLMADISKRISPKVAIESFTEGVVTVDTDEFEVFYTDEFGQKQKLNYLLTSHILKCVENQDMSTLNGLVKFTDKLLNNPSNRVVNRLYEFINGAGVTINEDGNVVCYKRITNDFLDIYTREISNKVGETVQVPRNQVDEDQNNTCSYGLHVCAYSYLSHYGTSHSSTIVEVHVDPADFVAIPADYNNAKARVCKYFINAVNE